MTDVVITCLLNRFPDPQYAGSTYKRTGGRWPADLSVLTVLDSVARVAPTAQRVVISDCLEPGDHDGVTVTRVENTIENAYFARWRHIADYLARGQLADTGSRWPMSDPLIWCVDGGDVEMLHDPFQSMWGNVLYLGSEPIHGPNARSLGFGWCRDFHPDSHDLIDAGPDRMLYNPGLVGGRRGIVMRFADEVANHWPTRDGTDVLAANRVAYSRQFHGRVVTGPVVHTAMWHHERTEAWFSHK